MSGIYLRDLLTECVKVDCLSFLKRNVASQHGSIGSKLDTALGIRGHSEAVDIPSKAELTLF